MIHAAFVCVEVRPTPACHPSWIWAPPIVFILLAEETLQIAAAGSKYLQGQITLLVIPRRKPVVKSQWKVFGVGLIDGAVLRNKRLSPTDCENRRSVQPRVGTMALFMNVLWIWRNPG